MDQEISIPEVKPEVVFVYELIREILDGKMRVPNFQRRFVWKREKMLDLLDSIRLQYPIGSILVWDADDSVASSEWVGPIHIPPAKQKPASYVLDGQQRLSTLVGVLQKRSEDYLSQPNLNDPGRWEVWFNAKNKTFEHITDRDIWHFPLWKLLDTVEFLNECQSILDSKDPSAREYVNAIQLLSRTFQSYKLPVIRIKKTGLSQAVEIFARLNSTGQKMSADQMVSALSYGVDQEGKPTFNLADKIDELIGRLDDQGFGEIDRNVVLRSFLAALEVDIYRTDWTKLADTKRTGFSKELPGIIVPTGDALERGATFLHTMGVRTNRLLPYAMQLVVLGAFFLKCPSPTIKQKEFLRRWFWVSSFTCRFASGNPSKNNALVAEFRDEVSQMNHPTSLKNMRLDGAAEPFPATFDMRSARVRALLLVLLSLKPKDNQGVEIPEPWKQISEHGPNSIGNIFATVDDKYLASSPANRILRIDMKNRSLAKAWLLELQNASEDIRNKVLESHCIPKAAFPALINNNPDEFLRQRLEHMKQIERPFMREECVTEPLSQESKSPAIDND